MTRRSYAVLILFVAVLILAAPFVSNVFAHTTGAQFPGDDGAPGIVPCGDEGDPECGLCQLGSLARDSLRFAIYLSTIIATLLFVYAGFLYVTAGGDSGKISQATSIFGKVVVGLVIILTAWLIVDLILQTLFVGSNLDKTKRNYTAPWNQIECVKPSQPSFRASQDKNINPATGNVDVVVPTDYCFEWINASNGSLNQECFYTATGCAQALVEKSSDPNSTVGPCSTPTAESTQSIMDVGPPYCLTWSDISDPNNPLSNTECFPSLPECSQTFVERIKDSTIGNVGVCYGTSTL